MVKAKYLGRHIMIKGKYIEQILNGSKKTTIRLGIVKPRYKEIIIHGGGRPIAKAIITKIYHKRVLELTDEDARLDGFSSREELLRGLREAYPDIRDDDWVTIIYFNITKRLDNLPITHPYRGLEPADIARLALRYLDRLSDEDKRVLLDLTRTNSIRATAYRLYGGINQRWRVRKILKRALRKLEERGLIGAKP